MPLVRLSAAEAAKNLRTRSSLWPDGRVPTDRLDGVAKVALKNGFTFSRADKIMTIGSCFAREIEKRLASVGFDLPMLDLALSPEERESSTANDMVNKYTVQSIVNEFAWAFGEAEPPPPERLFLQVGEDRWHDPQLIHNMEPAPLPRVIERRAMVRDAIRQLPKSRVLIVTLGLAEAWFDRETGLYLNGAPPTPAQRREPDRFAVDLLSYEDISESLEVLHGLVQRHGHPEGRILITVSPVPFKATFMGVDALQANTYSKAVQRAAVEAFVRRHEDVDYFPSFEIVTLTHRELAYEVDNIHVTAPVVAQIMDRVLAKYAPDVELPAAPVAVVTPAKAPSRVQAETRRNAPSGASLAELRRTAKFLAAERRYEEACDAYGELLDRFAVQLSEFQRGGLHLDFGVCLLRCSRTIDGVVQLRKAVDLLPNDHRAAFKLGLGLGRLKQTESSIVAFRRAADLVPSNAGYHARLGQAFERLGDTDEAVKVYRLALKADEANPEAKEGLQRLAAGIGAAA